MSSLYVVATPIGNLEDMTRRALRILSEVDLILCEDTRVTRKLLDHYQIKVPTLSYHQHSKLNKIEYVIQLLRSGKDLALVSDAGTPGISDPGNYLISKIMEAGFPLMLAVPVPGPSALTAAASISGFSMDRFTFMGFPPHKNKRKKFFEEVINSKYPVIFYESPYRILKTLKDLSSLTRELVICREMTKKFETVYRGTAAEIIGQIKKGEIRGEFAVIVNKE